MRHRILKTTKVLVVALAIAPGCAETATSAAPPLRPEAAEARAALDALSTELGSVNRDQALANLEHYRPLCDERGYPLVGNVQRKSMGPVLLPSEVCAEVRKPRQS